MLSQLRELTRFLEDPPARPESLAVRQRMLDVLLPTFTLAGGIPTALGAHAALRAGQLAFATAYVTIYAVFLIASVNSRRLSATFKALLLVILGSGFGIASLLRVGLNGVALHILGFFTVLAALVISPRVGFFWLAAQVAGIGALAVAVTHGAWSFEPSVLASSYQGTAWLNAALIFAITCFLLILIPRVLRNSLHQALDAQAQRQQELESTELALRESETRFRELAELLPETVFETDLTTRLTFVNRAGLDTFGYDSSALAEGMSVLALLAENQRDIAKARMARVLLGEDVGIFEYRAIRRDGESFPVLVRSAAILRDGKPTGLRGIGVDISDRKRIEARLQEVQRMEALGTLAGGLAHDFNNLLMGVQGRVSLARTCGALGNADGACEHLDAIEVHVESAARLTRQLLALGQGRDLGQTLRPTTINDLIERTAHMFGCARKELTLALQLAKEPLVALADVSRIEQLLLNLLVNAWQAQPRDGRIEISSGRVTLSAHAAATLDVVPGSYVHCAVRDRGVGIAPENLARIFDPFFTTKAPAHGTGLGLASAYGIARSHGGAIDVHSELGEGSTFHVYLPATSAAVPNVQTPEPSVLPRGHETLLLVDDETMILDVTRAMLEMLGYRVLVASRGEQAIELVRQAQPAIDLVLLDMIMPGLSGRQTFERLRALQPNLKVLISSGYSADGEPAALLARGCQGFMQKPYRVDELAGKVRVALDCTPS